MQNNSFGDFLNLPTPKTKLSAAIEEFGSCEIDEKDFIQENMKVLATVCDKHLGGRDFDDVIIEYMAETFQKKFGIDVRGNKKAVLKLQVWLYTDTSDIFFQFLYFSYDFLLYYCVIFYTYVWCLWN